MYYPYLHHSPSSCYWISLYSSMITLTPLMTSLLMSCSTMFYEVLSLTRYSSFLDMLVHAHLCLYKYDSLVLVTVTIICSFLISLLAGCSILTGRSSFIPFPPDIFGANRFFPKECSFKNILLYYLNLLPPSITFHFLCHTSHDKCI